ncbi:MAG: DUF2285 domain-containing protein [Sphingopyxis sp.]
MPPRGAACRLLGLPLAASRATGGWSFAPDPDRSAAEAPALWQPGACALVAIAQPAPPGLAAVRLADMVRGERVAAEIIGPREWHLVLLLAGRRYRLAIRCCTGNEELAYICPADAQGGFRLALAAALHRGLSGEEMARPPASADPGPTERWRLVQWLRLLDGIAAGASSRELAGALVAPGVLGYSAIEWDASSERRRIARWRRGALAMRDGGYRALLAAP